jgi:D-tyrosyl-tRNA(Tyr) deacylase
LFLKKLEEKIGADNVKDGVFGAMMDVALVNDGPVTITLDSSEYNDRPVI